ncbi:MAG: KpsF/GutQ family sugar-phosphate isomerase [Rhodospirillales bacterium]
MTKSETIAETPVGTDNTSGAERDLASARRVLSTEAGALTKLSAELGPSFSAALDALGAVEGRVVVTGMGKSGHIANKIAATLSSTGTPALYVHPAEASHGDLGMVTESDGVIALSNSGETAELSDIVAHAARYSIPLVAITGRADSTLAKDATVALVYPAAEEACPMGLAPTTSTTMMLALGDAIAVALLERKGFSTDDFQALHPGGQLGRRLMRVRDLMHTGDALPLVGLGIGLGDMIVTMTAKSFGCAGIVDDEGRLVGVFTDGDVRRSIGVRPLDTPARDLMTVSPKSIAPETLASEALRTMNEFAITNLFVVEDGRPVGIIHVHDCLRAGIV